MKNKLKQFFGVGVGVIALLIIGVPAVSSAATWDVTGDYVIDMYLENSNPHDMFLVQDSENNLTGNGGSPAGSNNYTWVITSGSVNSNLIEFFADYTATQDAVNPLTTIHVLGKIALNGTMSGTWSDNYKDGLREGTWTTTDGTATEVVPAILSAEDFGVVNYDTESGQIIGYTAGFGLSDGTLENAKSVIVELYSGDTLLQTNTAILATFNANITGTQFSSPFDVSGTFDYVADGYWTNVQESQYGQSVPATRVVATVILSDDQVVTAENTNLTGDLYPPTPVDPEITDKNQCKNGGWKTFTNPTFKNQGQCVSYVQSNENAGKRN